MVFTVAPILKDDVIRTVADFRRKDLFDGRAFTATQVEIQARRGNDRPREEQGQGRHGRLEERAARTSIRRRPTIC